MVMPVSASGRRTPSGATPSRRSHRSMSRTPTVHAAASRFSGSRRRAAAAAAGEGVAHRQPGCHPRTGWPAEVPGGGVGVLPVVGQPVGVGDDPGPPGVELPAEHRRRGDHRRRRFGGAPLGGVRPRHDRLRAAPAGQTARPTQVRQRSLGRRRRTVRGERRGQRGLVLEHVGQPRHRRVRRLEQAPPPPRPGPTPRRSPDGPPGRRRCARRRPPGAARSRAS